MKAKKGMIYREVPLCGTFVMQRNMIFDMDCDGLYTGGCSFSDTDAIYVLTPDNLQINGKDGGQHVYDAVAFYEKKEDALESLNAYRKQNIPYCTGAVLFKSKVTPVGVELIEIESICWLEPDEQPELKTDWAVPVETAKVKRKTEIDGADIDDIPF